tara:strand:- start:281 stop:487 length:207 start_codon:yes stop_codon:yes gene_type:complete
MKQQDNTFYRYFIEAHKDSPTNFCYRFRKVLCKVCAKLKEETPCDILACIDCNQHLFPEDFKHLTNFE